MGVVVLEARAKHPGVDLLSKSLACPMPLCCGPIPPLDL
jgi:hypothetical protein